MLLGNICLESPTDAVTTYCGHLYCNECIKKWFETKKNCPKCPVCKTAISRDKIIPLYGRNLNTGNNTDFRVAITTPLDLENISITLTVLFCFVFFIYKVYF